MRSALCHPVTNKREENLTRDRRKIPEGGNGIQKGWCMIDEFEKIIVYLLHQYDFTVWLRSETIGAGTI